MGTRRELLWGSFLATPLLPVGWGGDSPQAQPRGSLQASACCHCMRSPLESRGLNQRGDALWEPLSSSRLV